MRLYIRDKADRPPINKDLVSKRRPNSMHSNVGQQSQKTGVTESKFRYVCMYTDETPNNIHYGTSTEHTVKETISMILLTQFTHPSKKWLFSCHFEDQLNLWEINLSPPGQAHNSPPVLLKRVWWASTKVYNDFQPFCLTELKNKPANSSHLDYPDLEVKIKGDVVVGCDAGVLLFFDLNAVQNNVAVVGGVPMGGTKEIVLEKIKFNSYMRLPRPEPIIVIHELETTSQESMLLIGQVDGSITILNYATQEKILELRLELRI